MAKIRRWGVGGEGIEAYKREEPYYYEIDNRPLFNLSENDYYINEELQSLQLKRPAEYYQNKIGLVEDNTYTLPAGEKAIPGSLIVYLNGIAYPPDEILLLSGHDKFKIISNVVPDRNDDITLLYRVENILPSGESLENIYEFTESDLNIVFEDNLFLEIKPNPTLPIINKANYKYISGNIFAENFKYPQPRKSTIYLKLYQQNENQTVLLLKDRNILKCDLIGEGEELFNIQEYYIVNNEERLLENFMDSRIKGFINVYEYTGTGNFYFYINNNLYNSYNVLRLNIKFRSIPENK